MWAIFGLLSAFFLGIYDIFKKTSLKENAVIPVLFFATLTSALLFLPVVIGSVFSPDVFSTFGLYAPTLSLTEHLQVFLKSVIVLSSWILAFFAIKHLPVTVFSPIRATGPFWTLIGALIIFHERLNVMQWIGVLLTLLFFYLFSTTGKKEGIEFKSNKWVWFVIGGTLLGAVSGLYDKFIIARIDRIAVQAWFSIYQVFILTPVLGFLWYPKRKSNTPFQWRWSIPAIGLTLVVADFLYFYALSVDGSMISVISALRRSSVLITFSFGAFFLGEVNDQLRAALSDFGEFLDGLIAGL